MVLASWTRVGNFWCSASCLSPRSKTQQVVGHCLVLRFAVPSFAIYTEYYLTLISTLIFLFSCLAAWWLCDLSVSAFCKNCCSCMLFKPLCSTVSQIIALLMCVEQQVCLEINIYFQIPRHLARHIMCLARTPSPGFEIFLVQKLPHLTDGIGLSKLQTAPLNTLRVTSSCQVFYFTPEHCKKKKKSANAYGGTVRDLT